MPSAIDLSGQRFGRLTVIQRTDQVGAGAFWKCVCDCGAERAVFGQSLRRGRTTSCGCYQKESAAAKVVARLRRHGFARQGKDRAPEYSVWASMKARCSNPKTPNYALYGGRGIKVCERWSSFENFYADMGPRPAGHLIERINNDGDYEPSNCKWATRKEQNRNTGRNKFLEWRGESRCISEWAELLGIPEGVIRQRLFLGWDIDKTLTQPLRVVRRRK